jgi:hypothetical protein
MVNATPRPFYPRRKTRYPKNIGGLASGLVWTGAENLVPTGIRSTDLSTRSELLYRLSYPGTLHFIDGHENLSAGLCRHSVWYKLPDDLEESVVSVFNLP